MPRFPLHCRVALACTTGMALLMLTACGKSHDQPTQTDTASISFSADNTSGNASDASHSVSVSVPGFAAKLNVPGLAIGSDMSIDGIAFRPNTKIAGVNIVGAAGDGSGGEGHGTVEMRFTDPGAPDQVLAYYKQAAQQGGWTEVPPAAGQQFAATKHKDDGTEHLALQVGAAAAGSSGRFIVTGG
jgi:hypothetical protein